MKFWALEVEEVLKALKTDLNGISEEERKNRLKTYGLNEIKVKEKKKLLVFLKQFWNPLVLVLVVSMILLIYLNQHLEAFIVFAIIFLGAILGFLQEWKAESIMRELRKFLIPKALIFSGGKVVEIDSKNIVPGDIIIVEAGMKVPADARIVESKELFVDESMLTGESFPVEKNNKKVPEDAIVPERTCMLYAGSIVTSGWGKAVVVSTGERTEMGKIGKGLEESVQTPLIAKMGLFARQISIGIVFVSLLIFLLGLYRGYESSYAFLSAISFAVAVIPEILPATVTLALAFGVKEMAKRNTLIKSLPAVETLGGVTVICTDKTGTLTKNKLQVVKIVTPMGEYEVRDDGFYKNGEKVLGEDLRKIILAGYICNRAICESGNCKGDPLEIALLELAIRSGVTEDYEILDEIPFDSKRKFMAVSAKTKDGIYIIVKGAPEVVETMVSEKIPDICSAKGMRTIAFAFKRVDNFNGFDLKNLEFLGYQCLIDPLREDSRESVENCKSAGIRVLMVTGDHPSTALTIARNAGIEGDVITGKELENLDLREAVKKYSIFARTTPEQKLEIVKALQENGEVVAVTGDGVNDAPALKRAEIGIAMGSGSDIAKEAGDMVLMDDSFSTIVKAIEEGRNVFRKIQRMISWMLPTNGGQGMIVLVAFALGIAMPMLPLHILWINTVTSGLLGMMIVFEAREKDLLKMKPTRGEILHNRIIFRIIYISILSVVLAYYLYFDTGKMSSAVNAIIAVGIWYLLTPYIEKSFFEVGLRNKYAILGIFLTLALQIYVTNYSSILKLEPMSLEEWLKTLALTSSVFFVVEFEKLIFKFFNRKINTTF
ncbi:MAG: HAD-IC family P-type ATPase [Archaeoglobaceae archaeon]|nr:HAD-IC family P-type ATPase [Archaeoglobaceae archaeon]MDW8128440.1 HAD-IC family P-type ATPase [Archaeoglobaceae archaeon]